MHMPSARVSCYREMKVKQGGQVREVKTDHGLVIIVGDDTSLAATQPMTSVSEPNQCEHKEKKTADSPRTKFTRREDISVNQTVRGRKRGGKDLRTNP
jgi:hypothetical protein